MLIINITGFWGIKMSASSHSIVQFSPEEQKIVDKQVEEMWRVFECPVTLDIMTDPVILPEKGPGNKDLGHSLDLASAQRLLDAAKAKNADHINCPRCTREVKLTDITDKNGALNLEVDAALKQQIEAGEQAIRQRVEAEFRAKAAASTAPKPGQNAAHAAAASPLSDAEEQQLAGLLERRKLISGCQSTIAFSGLEYDGSAMSIPTDGSRPLNSVMRVDPGALRQKYVDSLMFAAGVTGDERSFGHINSIILNALELAVANGNGGVGIPLFWGGAYEEEYMVNSFDFSGTPMQKQIDSGEITARAVIAGAIIQNAILANMRLSPPVPVLRFVDYDDNIFKETWDKMVKDPKHAKEYAKLPFEVSVFEGDILLSNASGDIPNYAVCLLSATNNLTKAQSTRAMLKEGGVPFITMEAEVKTNLNKLAEGNSTISVPPYSVPPYEKGRKPGPKLAEQLTARLIARRPTKKV